MRLILLSLFYSFLFSSVAQAGDLDDLLSIKNANFRQKSSLTEIRKHMTMDQEEKFRSENQLSESDFIKFGTAYVIGKTKALKLKEGLKCSEVPPEDVLAALEDFAYAIVRERKKLYNSCTGSISEKNCQGLGYAMNPLANSTIDTCLAELKAPRNTLPVETVDEASDS